MKRAGSWLVCVALCCVGCSNDQGGNDDGKFVVQPPDEMVDVGPTAKPYEPAETPSVTPTEPTAPPAKPTLPPELVLPVDERPAVQAARVPPPISGGTLLVARDGVTAVASDPDRDRVSVVDLPSLKLTGEIALEPGDEPGRVVEDAAGRIHVALRGSGDVATLDLAELTVTERRAVCGSPRGIAYDEAADALHVACKSGELVTLPAAGGEAVRSVYVAPDLRDVVVQQGHVRVSQFRSATLFEIDDAGEIVNEVRPSAVKQELLLGNGSQGFKTHEFLPALARRTIAMDDGRTIVLHEREMSDTVEIPDPHDPNSIPMNTSDPAAGGYGSGDSCQSIVQTAVSVVDDQGNVIQSSGLSGAVVPMDVAMSPDGTLIAVANAGLRDPAAPVRSLGTVMSAPSFGGPLFQSGVVSIINTGEAAFHEGDELGQSCVFNTMPVEGQPTAVAFAGDGTLVVQSREPAKLFLAASTGMKEIALGGDSVLDTGHELFHRDAGGGIACASCHGEAGDDGHVWNFSGLGPRRTQSVNIGLAGTEPFHWSGDMKDLTMIMSEVFVTRMGGVPQSPERLDALSSWLFAQQPSLPIRSADDPAVVRGHAIFESEAAACGSCHSGEKLTNNKSVDVGTGGEFQVPSLVGIAYRAPFLHSGCAPTLRDRFDPACGGDKHGNTADLSDGQIDDLVAYLESL